MNKELFKEFIDNMYQIYNMKVSKSCMEFCQGENRILLKLSMEKNRTLTPSDLSNELEISRQRVTATLNSLKSKNLINMEKGKEDRRRIIITISKEGQDYITEKGNEVEKEMKVFVEKLGETKLKELNELLKIINN